MLEKAKSTDPWTCTASVGCLLKKNSVCVMIPLMMIVTTTTFMMAMTVAICWMKCLPTCACQPGLLGFLLYL